MRLGIDFGTTHTVVAVVDRGNYPVVNFQDENGDTQPWYPALIAVKNAELRFGLEAAARLQESGWSGLRSFKRLLAKAAMHSTVQIGKQSFQISDLLTAYLRQLRADLSSCSNLSLRPDEALEVVVSVPANASSNQRFITLDSFRQAGFHVLGMINEPSAAGFEYAHRYGPDSSKAHYIAVYDLGGGTFDVSVISMQDRHHQVLTSTGIPQLGGDDFDRELADLALELFPQEPPLSEQEYSTWLEECQSKKEALHPNTRKLSLDLGQIGREGELSFSVDKYYQRCAPLIRETLQIVKDTLKRAGQRQPDHPFTIDTLYVVGGGSAMPAVARVLREKYGRRVRRSLHPYAATAIGLSIRADSSAGYSLQERFTRHFGVWREQEAGQKASFEPIFHKDTPLPKPGEAALVHSYRYRPVHNLGHLRYLEATELDESGLPGDQVTPWADIFFPFDPALQEHADLAQIKVGYSDAASRQDIEERYECDAQGILRVTIINHTTAYQRSYHLSQSGLKE